MNPVQEKIISFFREAKADIDNGGEYLSDERIARMLFINYRPSQSQKGYRLTHFGLQFMKRLFDAIEIPRETSDKLHNREILYMEKRATLPYYASDKKIVVFENDIAIRLRLAGGNILTLIEMEEPLS